MKSLLSFKYTKIITGSVLLVLSVMIFFITYQRSQQGYQPLAWDTDQSAETVCLDSGNVGIRVTFTNKESDSNDGMIVSVLENQSGKTLELGTVQPGQSANGTIDTELQTIAANTVQFRLKWANNSNDTDARTSAYSAITCQTTITPTAGISITTTPAVTQTPSLTPTHILTPTISSTPSASLTPTTAITTTITTTPTLTPTIRLSTTITPQATYTPQPTYTPNPTSSQSPTPTEIIIVVNNTNTPTPQGQTTTEPTIPTAGSPIAWFMILIPVALLTLGLVL